MRSLLGSSFCLPPEGINFICGWCMSGVLVWTVFCRSCPRRRSTVASPEKGSSTCKETHMQHRKGRGLTGRQRWVWDSVLLLVVGTLAHNHSGLYLLCYRERVRSKWNNMCKSLGIELAHSNHINNVSMIILTITGPAFTIIVFSTTIIIAQGGLQSIIVINFRPATFWSAGPPVCLLDSGGCEAGRSF